MLSTAKSYIGACLLALALSIGMGAFAMAADPYTAGDGVVPLAFGAPEFSSQGESFSAAQFSSGGIIYGYRVGMVGDSHAENTDMLTVLQERLNNPWGYGASAIPAKVKVYSEGLGGYRTDGIRREIEASNYAAGYDFVCLMAGTNDLTQGYYQGWDWGSQLNGMVENMQAIINAIAERNTPGRPRIVVSCTLPTMDANINVRAQEFNERLRTELYGYDVYTEYNWYDLYNANTSTAIGEFMRDNVHPNVHGNYRIAENWLQGIDALYDEEVFTNNRYIYKADGYWSGW